ncbi:MAG: uroporphyrinogen-III synthase [Gemmatimonadota bacterium]
MALPLHGVRVAVTRPEDSAAELVDGLRALGAEVAVHPLIRVAPPADEEAVRQAARGLATFDWVVFTSVNAVTAFAAAAAAVGSVFHPGMPRVAAVGPTTADALRTAGIAVDTVPGEYAGRTLPEAMAESLPLAGARVLLPRSAIGREELPALLREAGANVEDVAVYRTLGDRDGAAALTRALRDGALDVVTFTSPSTVRCLAEVCPVWPSRVRVAVIGPATAAAARDVDFPVHAMPEDYTAAGLVGAVVRAAAAGL